MGQGIRRNQNAKVGPDGYGGSTHRAEGSLQRMALASELVVQWWPSIHPVPTRLKDTHPQGLARSPESGVPVGLVFGYSLRIIAGLDSSALDGFSNACLASGFFTGVDGAHVAPPDLAVAVPPHERRIPSRHAVDSDGQVDLFTRAQPTTAPYPRRRMRSRGHCRAGLRSGLALAAPSAAHHRSHAAPRALACHIAAHA